MRISPETAKLGSLACQSRLSDIPPARLPEDRRTARGHARNHISRRVNTQFVTPDHYLPFTETATARRVIEQVIEHHRYACIHNDMRVNPRSCLPFWYGCRRFAKIAQKASDDTTLSLAITTLDEACRSSRPERLTTRPAISAVCACPVR